MQRYVLVRLPSDLLRQTAAGRR